MDLLFVISNSKLKVAGNDTLFLLMVQYLLHDTSTLFDEPCCHERHCQQAPESRQQDIREQQQGILK